MMFHPLDPRNTAAYNALDTYTLPEGVMRVSLANGYGLCSVPIDVRDIDTIMECGWDPEENKWNVSYLYMKQLVESDVRGTKGNTLKDYTRVAKLVIKARNSEGLRLPEGDLFVKCTGMLSGSDQEKIEEQCERDPENRDVLWHRKTSSRRSTTGICLGTHASQTLSGMIPRYSGRSCFMYGVPQRFLHAW